MFVHTDDTNQQSCFLRTMIGTNIYIQVQAPSFRPTAVKYALTLLLAVERFVTY